MTAASTATSDTGHDRVPPREPAPLRDLQPMLHALTVCLAAPTTVLGGTDGQIRHVGAQGAFHADVRVLSRAEVRVGGHEPEAVSDGPSGPGGHDFVALLRHLGDDTPDPTVRLDRRRAVTPGRIGERLTLSSTAVSTVSTEVELTLAADFAAVEEVKQGRRRMSTVPTVDGTRVAWSGPGPQVTLAFGPGTPVPRIVVQDGAAVLRWSVRVMPRGAVELEVDVVVTDTGGVVAPAPPTPWWPAPTVRADDRRLAPLLAQSLADLHGLRMVTRDHPDEVFVAAGSPWYLTLFGRDSLWAARMMLPFGTGLAGGTLRTLAARQGVRDDPLTQEQPGKILHELRRSDVGDASVGMLPAQYFGTVDATPLWVLLLHDAWRWGLPADEVEPLVDNAVRALDWVLGDGDPDGDGFCEYVDDSGTGLANQGWKDSGDSVRFADGTLATPPIALCEVQGYAYAAARAGVDLLAAFGRDGRRYAEWADALRVRFRDRFWVSVDGVRYPAMALDGGGPGRQKRQVDSLTSNIGHLLGTGLLDENETSRVVSLLTGSDMDSGYGLRTMSGRAGGYSPLSYHCGSVWPHDTAIVVDGLARAGHASAAAGLIDGVLAAAGGFGYRVPELFSGEPRAQLLRPVPYPAACRPQAWSA
ncbi:MAG: amylo-alpha-1,6-glucosidase, partial [Geodermatophilaceae bacterium]|nr:amylo-alpha-1,6-glucosidase [Geodermatophilaceae bacterium]